MIQAHPDTNRQAASFLEVRGVSRHFGAFVALDDVSLDVREGEFVSVLGPSGCGKTTLLRIIAGLDRPNRGEIWIRQRNMTRTPVAQRDLGIVFQSYALFPNLTVWDNVQYGLRRLNAAQRKKRASEVLELVGLSDQAAKYPAQISGGQQQRVALARALAPNPSLLLLDEPLSALDARVRLRLRAEVRQIQSRLGITTVMVTHDQEEALTMADRIVVLNAGRLMQCSNPERLYRRPANAFVAGFIGAMNFLPDCRRTAADSVQFLDYTLRVGDADPIPAGAPVTLAIRPEHPRLAEPGDHGHNRIRVQVEATFFRGPVSRVQVRALRIQETPTPITLALDLQPQTIEQLRLYPARIVDLLMFSKLSLHARSLRREQARALRLWNVGPQLAEAATPYKSMSGQL